MNRTSASGSAEGGAAAHTNNSAAELVELMAVRLERLLAQDSQDNAAIERAQLERSLEGGITIRSMSPDGFDITLYSLEDRVIAWFGGLDCEFSSLAEAAEWVCRARSPDYRLRIDYIGNDPIRWTLEHVPRDGAPRDALASGYPVLFPAFRRKRSEYRHNSHPRMAAE